MSGRKTQPVVESGTERASGLAPFLGVQFERCLKRRKVVVLGIILLLPVALSVAALVNGASIPWAEVTRVVGLIYTPFLLPLVALFYGGPIIVEEIEQRTYIYLLLRPVPRYQLFLGKLLAASATTLLLTSVSVGVFVGVQSPLIEGASMAAQSVGRIAGALVLGTMAYVSLFAALASVFGRSMLAGILYFILFEWGISRLPVLELMSIRFHLYRVLEFVPQESPTERLLPAGIEVEPWISALVLAVGALVFVIVGAVISELRQYRS